MRNRVQLLNAWVDDVTMDELVETFREGLLLTLHTDMLVKLQHDREFHDILPAFDVTTCDSQILFWAAKFLGTPLRARVSGSDFFPRFYMKHRADPAVTIFICGGRPEVTALARENVNAKAGREIVVGHHCPPPAFEEKPEELDRTLRAINDSRATVLLVGLGGGRQEKFIVRHRDRLPHVKAFLPLGGTIDYEAGTLPRPSPWVTNAGLEWFYRVLKEPRARWHRYFVQQPPALFHIVRQRLGLYRDPFGADLQPGSTP